MKREWLTRMRELMFVSAIVATPVPYAQAQQWTGIYHNIPGKTGYEVPGLGGTGFQSTTAATAVFADVVASGNGNWGLRGRVQLANTMDDILIVNGERVAREGTSASFAPSENYGPLTAGGFRFNINDSSSFVFLNNTSGPSAADDYVVKGIGGTQSAVAKEGEATGLPGLSVDIKWSGDTLNNVVITDEGEVGFTGLITGSGVTPSNNSVAVLGDQIIARRGVTIPGNQAGGGSASVDEFGRFAMSVDGSHYVLEANLSNVGTSSKSAIVDGELAIEANQIIPGMFSPVVEVWTVNMDQSGNWFAKGVNLNNQDWLIRNGVKIAAEGEPVPGSLGVWTQLSATADDVFSVMTGNAAGDWLIAGADNSGGGGSLSALMMLNGAVIVRQGDPVDLDGNGLFDDDTYFGHRFISAAITNSGAIYTTAFIQDGAGQRKGAGLFVFNAVPEPMSSLLLLIGSFGFAAIRRRHP
jgi:hypothetical protein